MRTLRTHKRHLVFRISQLRHDEAQTFAMEFLGHIDHGRIIVRHHQHRFVRQEQIRNDIENRLCFPRTRRPLHDTHLMAQSCFHRGLLTRIAPEGVINHFGKRTHRQFPLRAEILRQRHIVSLHIHTSIALRQTIVPLLVAKSRFVGQLSQIVPHATADLIHRRARHIHLPAVETLHETIRVRHAIELLLRRGKTKQLGHIADSLIVDIHPLFLKVDLLGIRKKEQARFVVLKKSGRSRKTHRPTSAIVGLDIGDLLGDEHSPLPSPFQIHDHVLSCVHIFYSFVIQGFLPTPSSLPRLIAVR